MSPSKALDRTLEMMSGITADRIRRRPGALAPAGLALYLWGAALLGVSSRYAPLQAALLAALYLCLALALWWGAVLLRRLGGVPGALGAVGLGGVMVWHLRELTYLPASLAALAVLSLLLAVPWFFLLGAARGPAGVGATVRRASWTLAAAAAVLLMAWLPARASNTFRWHLLRHNKLLGTPVYYLLEPSVERVKRALFTAHRQGPAAAAPPPSAAGPDPLAAPGPPGPPGPNIVFVLFDTLRADALAGWGGEANRMPRLDALLERSYRFTDVLANASWTRASMGSFFTGLLPEEHGARDTDDLLGDEQVTLAEVLRERGYHTAAFVSNHAAVGRNAGFAQGFEVFFEIRADPYARAGQVRRLLRRWLEEHAGEHPGEGGGLFLYLHFLDPHDPYLAGVEPRYKSFAEYMAAYRAELAYLDEQFARVVDLVERRVPGPTLWLFASDHGEEFGEHEEFGHGVSLYDEVVDIPVALLDPRRPGGEIPAELEGRDFFDLLTRLGSGREVDVAAWAAEHRRARRYTSIYWTTTGRLALRPYLRAACMRSIEEGGRKLIWSAYGSTFELYDVNSDPGETRNLAAANPGEVDRLRRLLEGEVGSWTFSSSFQPSEEDLEQLRALGYL